jgi:hypothetical protein
MKSKNRASEGPRPNYVNQEHASIEMAASIS